MFDILYSRFWAATMGLKRYLPNDPSSLAWQHTGRLEKLTCIGKDLSACPTDIRMLFKALVQLTSQLDFGEVNGSFS
jgi:hypothetical protein